MRGRSGWPRRCRGRKSGGCLIIPAVFLSPLLGFAVVAVGSWLLTLPIIGIIVMVLMFGIVGWGIFVVIASPQGVEGYGEPHG